MFRCSLSYLTPDAPCSFPFSTTSPLLPSLPSTTTSPLFPPFLCSLLLCCPHNRRHENGSAVGRRGGGQVGGTRRRGLHPGLQRALAWVRDWRIRRVELERRGATWHSAGIAAQSTARPAGWRVAATRLGGWAAAALRGRCRWRAEARSRCRACQRRRRPASWPDHGQRQRSVCGVSRTGDSCTGHCAKFACVGSEWF